MNKPPQTAKKHFHPASNMPRYKKSAKRKSLGEGRWRTCKEASVATAGPKRPELMALGARHQKNGKENILLNLKFL